MSLDLVDLIAAFHLYVLPLIVLGTVVAALVWQRADPARSSNPEEPQSDPADVALRLKRLARERTVRRIGLLNYGLALRSLLMVVVSVQAIWVLGDTWLNSIFDVTLPIVAAIVNLLIGLGLRRLRPWARWLEVVWNALISGLALWWASWLLRHGVSVDPASWPDLAITNVLPPFLATVMLLPGTRQVVSAEHRALITRTRDLQSRPARRSVVSALVLGFLVVVGSVVVVDAVDWLVRIRPEMALTQKSRLE